MKDLDFVIFGLTYGLALVMLYTFWIAYFSGQYKVMVWINTIGEAHLEMIVFTGIIIVATILFAKRGWEIHKGETSA